jgi:hypothetical protein
MKSNSTAYIQYFNRVRPHQGIEQQIQSRKLVQCQQSTQVARLSPSLSWVGFIMTIAEVHEFLLYVKM